MDCGLPLLEFVYLELPAVFDYHYVFVLWVDILAEEELTGDGLVMALGSSSANAKGCVDGSWTCSLLLLPRPVSEVWRGARLVSVKPKSPIFRTATPSSIPTSTKSSRDHRDPRDSREPRKPKKPRKPRDSREFGAW